MLKSWKSKNVEPMRGCVEEFCPLGNKISFYISSLTLRIVSK